MTTRIDRRLFELGREARRNAEALIRRNAEIAAEIAEQREREKEALQHVAEQRDATNRKGRN